MLEQVKALDMKILKQTGNSNWLGAEPGGGATKAFSCALLVAGRLLCFWLMGSLISL